MKCGICGRVKEEFVVDREEDETQFFSLYVVCPACDMGVKPRAKETKA